MKLGIFGFGYDLNPVKKYRLIKENGFDYTSIWWGDEFATQVGGKKEYQVELARKAGLIIENAHTPFDGVNHIWENTLDSEHIVKTYSDAILACGNLSIPSVVIHPTSGKTPPPFSKIGIYHFKRLVDLAEQANVYIALENLRKPKYLNQLLSVIPSDRLRICYDSGHANCFQATDILEAYPEKLDCLHLHDNDGITDQHLLPGEGNIDWTELSSKLKACGYQGPVSLEVTNLNSPIYKDYSMIDYLKVASEKAKKIARLIEA